jgi:hypothetical protein
MIRRLLRRLRRLQPGHARPGVGKSLQDQELDARLDTVQGKGMTATGNVIDFEADEKPPRY